MNTLTLSKSEELWQRQVCSERRDGYTLRASTDQKTAEIVPLSYLPCYTSSAEKDGTITLSTAP